MFVDRDSGAQEDAVPESTRRTLRYDARDCGHAADVPADGYVPIPQTRALEPESAPADATQPAVRLGGDWIQTMDASSGDLYYCNLKTGESSWDKPAELFRSAAAGVARRESNAARQLQANFRGHVERKEMRQQAAAAGRTITHCVCRLYLACCRLVSVCR